MAVGIDEKGEIKMVNINFERKMIEPIELDEEWKQLASNSMGKMKIRGLGKNKILFFSKEEKKAIIYRIDTNTFTNIKIDSKCVLEDTKLENAFILRIEKENSLEFLLFVILDSGDSISFEKHPIPAPKKSRITSSFLSTSFALISKSEHASTFVANLFNIHNTSLIKHKTFSLPFEINYNERGFFYFYLKILFTYYIKKKKKKNIKKDQY